MSWQRVASLDDVEVGAALRVDLAEPVCLVRTAPTQVKAVHDVCSHEEYDLHSGWVEGSTIECALHGSTFDLDSGQPETLPAVDPVPVYACRVVDGEIEVDLAAQRNDAHAPRH